MLPTIPIRTSPVSVSIEDFLGLILGVLTHGPRHTDQTFCYFCSGFGSAEKHQPNTAEVISRLFWGPFCCRKCRLGMSHCSAPALSLLSLLRISTVSLFARALRLHRLLSFQYPPAVFLLGSHLVPPLTSSSF